MNTIFTASYLGSVVLFWAGYTLRCLPRYTKKWGDDRTLEQLGSFFYGAALVLALW